jgi:hypothetical protein
MPAGPAFFHVPSHIITVEWGGTGALNNYDTFNRDHHLFTIGGHGLEQRLRAGGQMAMHHERTVVVQHTDVHGASMQVNAAGTLVLLGVALPEVSSASWLLFPLPAYHRGMLRRGPQ